MAQYVAQVDEVQSLLPVDVVGPLQGLQRRGRSYAATMIGLALAIGSGTCRPTSLRDSM
jgi:hypothetical protein